MSSRLPRSHTAVTFIATASVNRQVRLRAQHLWSCSYQDMLPTSLLCEHVIVHMALCALQGMIAGLCESYGSVISLATYVHVLTEDADRADTIVGRATADLRAEFDRCLVFFDRPV